MVIGIDKFKEYFKDFTGSYIIIGGTACDIILDDAGFTPRATKDIDMILTTGPFKNILIPSIKDSKQEYQESILTESFSAFNAY